MAYGTIKVDNITFDNGGVDKLITVSGLFYSTSGALTVTGTISGGNVVAPTATFTTLTGTTTAGTTATFTSGSFTSLTGVTTTVTSGIFGLGSAAAPSITFSGDSNTGIYSPGADQVAISTSGTGRLFIDASGLVGIGTTSPGSTLHVENSAAFDAQILAKQTASIAGVCAIRAQSNSAIVDLMAGGSNYGANYMDQDEAGLITQTAGDSMRFNIGGSYCRWTFGSSEKARLDSSGRLLVGTTASIGLGGILQVVGGDTARPQIHRNINDIYPAVLYMSKARGTGVQSVSSGDEIATIAFDGFDGTQELGAASIRCFVDGTPGTGYMPGRLVFSTTADGAPSPTERMRITQAGRFNNVSTEAGIFSETTQAAGTSFVVFQGRYSATAGSPLSGTTSFQVYSNGNVQNTNNSYGAISDAKLKENIVDATSQWADVKAFRIRKYNFKEGQTHTQLGVVANEIELISPGLVSESPDRDAEGNDLGTVTKSVNYSVLYMKAVKALQETMERIETLEANNADMLARLTALEAA